MHHTLYLRITTSLLVIILMLTGCTQTIADNVAATAAPAPISSNTASTEPATTVVEQVATTVTIVPSFTVVPPTPSLPPSATVAPPTPSVPASATVAQPTQTKVKVTPTPRSEASTTPVQQSPELNKATTTGASQVTAEHAHTFPVHSNGKVSYGRYHHDYPAADIFCPIGSQFVAVIDGVVDYVSREDTWDPKVNSGESRGGLSVAIIGDDGVRYYGSHLSQVADGIEPGVRVQAGQLLGLTGKSGDARYVQPHLHFGISHPTTADDWAVRRGEIQPYPYLKAWQQGEDVTPKVR